MGRPKRPGGPSRGVESASSPGRQLTPSSDRGGTGHHPRASRLARATTQVKILVPGEQNMVALLGQRDELLKLIEAAFDCEIVVRGNEITIGGPEAEVERVALLFEELVALLERGHELNASSVGRSIELIKGEEATPTQVLGDVFLTGRGRGIAPKTLGQKRYVDAMRDGTVTFAIGPAGTGKTYLAVATAVRALQDKQVSRLILTRPAVEAGERLGFLPGTLYEKIDPYMKPLYDALFEMMGADALPRLMERGTVEVAPLAYMRGRAQPYDSRVLTPDGYRPIGSLRVGDLVCGSNGLPTPVLGVYPQGRKEVFRLRSQDGASTLCCENHLWAVTTASDRRRSRSPRVLETKEMIGHLRAAHAHRFELPVLTAPVAFVPREVPMDPYALGLLLGDGCITTSTTPSFSTKDPELALALEMSIAGVEVVHRGGVDYTLKRRGGSRGGVAVANPVTAVLRELGLAGTRSSTKFVPEDYLLNSPEVRLAVLQGLLDTDGGPVTQSRRTCRVQYATTSSRLREDVKFLVRSLGGIVYERTRSAIGRRPGRARGRSVEHRSDAFVLDIRLPQAIEPFRLTRKLWTYRICGGAGRPMRFVDSIEPTGEQETLCIQVAAEDSLYVTDDFLVTHNTLNDSFIILDEAQNTTPEQMKMFLTRLGFGSKAVVNGDVTQIDLPNGQTSGLVVVQDILRDIDGIEVSHLGARDVVRHKIVQDIVEAYRVFGEQRARADG
jgi:phosphate starvation-inducible protein PhoH and related proteins